MLRRTLCKCFGYEAVAGNMIQVWRMYGDRVGEVHANIENIHWSVTQTMLQSYLDAFVKTTDLQLDKDPRSRNGTNEMIRLAAGKSLGSASLVFAPGQDEALAKFFRSRHVLNGKELLLRPAVSQPVYNFYLPNTHEDDAKDMSSTTVRRMATQMLDMSLLIHGRIKNNTVVELQQLADNLRKQKKNISTAEPANPDKPWFYEMSEDKWGDPGEKGPDHPAAPKRKPIRQPKNRKAETKAERTGPSVIDEYIKEAEYEALSEESTWTGGVAKRDLVGKFGNIDTGSVSGRGRHRS